MGNSAVLAELLEKSGAILKGHFLLTSGRHSDTYFEKFRVLEQPRVLSALCSEIARHFEGRVDLVAGPTTGGIIIAFEVARQMGLPALYFETEDGKRTLRRGATMPANARALVVDDVLTTGKSVREVVDAISALGGRSVGVGVLISRAAESLDFGCPLFASYTVTATSYPADEVPDWLMAIPVRKPGTSTH